MLRHPENRRAWGKDLLSHGVNEHDPGCSIQAPLGWESNEPIPASVSFPGGRSDQGAPYGARVDPTARPAAFESLRGLAAPPLRVNSRYPSDGFLQRPCV